MCIEALIWSFFIYVYVKLYIVSLRYFFLCQVINPMFNQIVIWIAWLKQFACWGFSINLTLDFPLTGAWAWTLHAWDGSSTTCAHTYQFLLNQCFIIKYLDVEILMLFQILSCGSVCEMFISLQWNSVNLSERFMLLPRTLLYSCAVVWQFSRGLLCFSSGVLQLVIRA